MESEPESPVRSFADFKSDLEKMSDHPAFKRGQSDVQKNLPPREGSQEYYTGYAHEWEQKYHKTYTPK